MAIEFKKTSYSGHTPEIWRGECKMLPGGFKLNGEVPNGAVVYRGTPVEVSFPTLTAKIAKTAKILDGGTTTKPRVEKGHLFAVGDKIVKEGESSEISISAIDTSKDGYDTLTLASAYAGLAKDDVIALSGVTPNMVVGADKAFDGTGLPVLDVAYEAVVLYPSLTNPILSDWLEGGCTLKSNHNILFIKQ